MAVLKDFYCGTCDEVFFDRWTDDPPTCCGVTTKPMIHAPKNFEWGGQRTYIHLRDEPFQSRSELNAYAKKNGLVLGTSSEKVGGARNDMYEGIGKIFSYKGANGKQNKLYSDKPRRQ